MQSQRSLLKTVGETLDGARRLRGERAHVRRLGDAARRRARARPAHGLVERLRAVKDEHELATIREAARITDEAYAAFAEERFVGRTERDLAWRMEQIFHELGAHGDRVREHRRLGPDRRAAARPSRPTASSSRTTTVVVDAGAVLDGYNSDCTRTFATGDLPDDLAEAYDVCLRGQLAGLDAMRAGVSGADADAAARSVIEDAGLGEKFGHGLGHGVGLLVHEAPTARPESEDVLEPGNVVTCEPGHLPRRARRRPHRGPRRHHRRRARSTQLLHEGARHRQLDEQRGTACQPVPIAPFPLVRRGDTVFPVRPLQQLLCARSHDVAVDGIFGPQTESAVEAFQQDEASASTASSARPPGRG